jgi:hypothetical protein
MDATIPGHVHETDEFAACARADPTEAVPLDLRLPIVLEDRMAKSLGVQRIDLGVREVAPPVVGDVRPAMVGPGAATERSVATACDR